MMPMYPELKWRIDFNENGEVGELLEELSYWSEAEKAAIDFLEDPVPYFSGSWERLAKESGLTMALDRNLEKALSEVEVQVVKPAVQEMKSGPRVIVTSYMDHPLGQTFAAWEAARVKVKEICGLQTHGLFEANEFIEALGISLQNSTYLRELAWGLTTCLKLFHGRSSLRERGGNMG
jgi:O-succinylbenzoate synthase